MLLTSLVVAMKLHEDVACTNSFYAKVGGIPNAALNAAELQLLSLLKFRAATPISELTDALAALR